MGKKKKNSGLEVHDIFLKKMNLSKMCFLHPSNREIHSSLLGLYVNYLTQHLKSGKNTKKWGGQRKWESLTLYCLQKKQIQTKMGKKSDSGTSYGVWLNGRQEIGDQNENHITSLNLQGSDRIIHLFSKTWKPRFRDTKWLSKSLAKQRLSSQPHGLPWTTGRCRGFFSLPPLGTVLGLYLSWSFEGQLCSIRAPQAFLQETPFTHVSRTPLTWCWENNKRPHLDYDSGGGTLAKTQHIPEINPEEAWGNTQIKEFPRITSC